MIEQGVKFTIAGEDGTIAVLNDSTDPNFVGLVTAVSGFDSPDIVADFQKVTEGHGGIHGPGYASRKQPGLEGIIQAQNPAAWNPKISRLARATWAVEADGVIRWTPTGEAIERAMWFRTNESNPLRISDRIPKRFQFGLSVEEWRVLSYLLQSPAAVTGTSPVVTVTNSGDIAGPLFFTVTGPVTNPVVTQSVTGKKFRLAVALTAGQTRTVYFWPPDPGVLVLNGTANADGDLDVSQTDLDLVLRSGSNTFTLTGSGTTTATALRVEYRHAWRV